MMLFLQRVMAARGPADFAGWQPVARLGCTRWHFCYYLVLYDESGLCFVHRWPSICFHLRLKARMMGADSGSLSPP